ncbi:MAG: hypothetical protein JRD00_10010 [Deltaproteobacteria bacterium]|nr:hypothetical protein [Deltaproteobacteria bacterium]
MKSKVQIRLFIALLSLIMFTILATICSGQGKTVRVECKVNAGPCWAHISGTKVSLDIEPKPVKAMHDLTLPLTLI